MDQVKKTEACPLCDGHRLEVRRDLATKFRYLGKDVVLDGQEHTVCADCGFSFLDDGQTERNNELFYALEAKVVKGIAPRKVLELRQKYGLTQAQAVKIFKVPKRSFSKWERGEVAPAAGIANTLLLALKYPDYMRIMADEVGETVDLPPCEKLVPHAVVKDLQEKLARRETEVTVRIQAAYAAGKRDGMQRKQVFAVRHTMGAYEAAGSLYARFDSMDDFPQVVLWQKEKVRQHPPR